MKYAKEEKEGENCTQLLLRHVKLRFWDQLERNRKFYDKSSNVLSSRYSNWNLKWICCCIFYWRCISLDSVHSFIFIWSHNVIQALPHKYSNNMELSDCLSHDTTHKIYFANGSFQFSSAEKNAVGPTTNAKRIKFFCQNITKSHRCNITFIIWLCVFHVRAFYRIRLFWPGNNLVMKFPELAQNKVNSFSLFLSAVTEFAKKAEIYAVYIWFQYSEYFDSIFWLMNIVLRLIQLRLHWLPRNILLIGFTMTFLLIFKQIIGIHVSNRKLG